MDFKFNGLQISKISHSKGPLSIKGYFCRLNFKFLKFEILEIMTVTIFLLIIGHQGKIVISLSFCNYLAMARFARKKGECGLFSGFARKINHLSFFVRAKRARKV
jgi:hypothetical protein